MISTKSYIKRSVCLNNILKSFSTQQNNKTSPLSYCTDIVRQHDHENFLATLLLPESLRSPAFVVRAFNVEVARIHDLTKDVNIAKMRLQFWSDAVDQIFAKRMLANVPAHPVVQSLHSINANYKLPKHYLKRLISCRNVQIKYFNTMEDLEKYADESTSSIYYIMLKVAGVNNIDADHVASHLGKAQGISNLLRSFDIWIKHKMVPFPMDILANHNVSQEAVLRGVDENKLKDITFDVATQANSHLRKARTLKVPKEATSIFLSAAAVDLYLQNIESNNFSLQTLKQKSSWKLPFILYRNKILNKF